MDEANTRIWFVNYWDTGCGRIRNTNLEHAKDRLEWVLKQNPDIDQERLKLPPELQDIYYTLSKSLYVDSFKESAKLIACGAACGVAAYLGIYGAFAIDHTDLPSRHLLSDILFCLSLVPIIPGLLSTSYGISYFVDGIKDYVSFKRGKWNRPLTPRERDLASYVFIKEG